MLYPYRVSRLLPLVTGHSLWHGASYVQQVHNQFTMDNIQLETDQSLDRHSPPLVVWFSMQGVCNLMRTAQLNMELIGGCSLHPLPAMHQLMEFLLKEPPTPPRRAGFTLNRAGPQRSIQATVQSLLNRKPQRRQPVTPGHPKCQVDFLRVTLGPRTAAMTPPQ